MAVAALDSERAVLRLAMTRPDVLDELERTVPESHLSTDRHRWWYRTILKAKTQGVEPDLIYLSNAIKDGNGTVPTGLTIGWIAKAFSDSAGSASNLSYYLSQMREWYQKDRARRAAEETAAMVEDGADVGSISTTLKRLADDLEGTRTRPSSRLDPATILTAEPEPIPWMVQGWMAEDEICLLAGEWGSGKSTVACDLAIALASGTPWMARVPVTRKYRVLYVDEEMPIRLARLRVRQLLVGREMTWPEGLTYAVRNNANLDDPAGLAWLENEMRETKPEVLFLDALVRFHMRDENSNSEMADFFRTKIRHVAEKHRCSAILVDHMGKPSKDRKDPGHRIRGASEKPSFADTVWTVGGDRDVAERRITHEKARYDEKSSPMVTKWEQSEDKSSATLTAQDEKPTAERTALRMLAVTGAGGCLQADIVEQAREEGVDDRSTRKVLERLFAQGRVKREKESYKTVRYWLSDEALAAQHARD
jgi:hypothetical protein